MYGKNLPARLALHVEKATEVGKKTKHMNYLVVNGRFLMEASSSAVSCKVPGRYVQCDRH